MEDREGDISGAGVPPRFKFEDRLVSIGDNPAEIHELADAIVRGAGIAYARIKDLRAIVNAVMAHPEARLASLHAKSEMAKVKGKDRAKSTQITLRRCWVESGSAHFSYDNIRCKLDFRKCFFADDVGFDRVQFSSDVGFAGSVFAACVKFNSVCFIGDAIFASCRFESAASFHSAAFSSDTSFGSAVFFCDAVFKGSIFSGTAKFSRARFKLNSSFGDASFECNADFDGATFGGRAGFGGATFCSDARFGLAEFNGSAGFGGTHFSGNADFCDAHFRRRCVFADSCFDRNGEFKRAQFDARTVFAGACFKRHAAFGRSKFEGDVWFGAARFEGVVGFGDAAFFKKAGFGGASICGRLVGDMRGTDLRAVLFSDAATLISSNLSTSKSQTYIISDRVKRASRWFGWHRVRSMGELAILNRVSLVALIAVPVLAAVWPLVEIGVRATYGGVEQSVEVLDDAGRSVGEAVVAIESLEEQTPEVMEPVVSSAIYSLTHVREAANRAGETFDLAKEHVGGWRHISTTMVFTFLAALLVTLGRLVYQILAPPMIQKFDEDAFVDDTMQRYSKGEGSLREDGLRRATEALERIASVRPDRHATLVSHHGETVWIPPKEQIDWFQDTVNADEEEDRDLDIDQPGYVPGEERARIALEEGARAEYWLKAREVQEIDRGSAAGGRAILDEDEHVQRAARMPWKALLSFVLYAVGIACLLVILGLQVWAVTKAGGWALWLRIGVLAGAPVLVVGLVLLGARAGRGKRRSEDKEE